jgi:hypothetical protein
MARRAVFARRGFGHAAETGPRLRHRLEAANRQDVTQTQAREMGQPESARAFRYVREGVAAGVTVGCGVRHRAHAEPVEHEEEGFGGRAHDGF